MKDSQYEFIRQPSNKNARAFSLSGVHGAVRDQYRYAANAHKHNLHYEEFLQKIPFRIFGTQTFRDVYTANGIHRNTGKLLLSLRRCTGQNYFAFIAVERGEQNGRWHSHYLLSPISKRFDGTYYFPIKGAERSVSNVIETLRCAGFEKFGFNDIRRITSSAECIEYCAKYCLKSNNFDLYDFQIIGE